MSQLEGCVEVACGTAVSYAVTGAGKLYRWKERGDGIVDDVY